MKEHYPLYINGEFVDTARSNKIINPADGQIVAKAAVADARLIDSALKAARQAFDQGPWPKISLAERKDFILRIGQGILDNAAELAQLETLNTGKPIKEATFMDIPSCAKTLQHFAQNLEKYLETENIEISTDIAQAQSKLLREPLGVAVLIVPWNYPLLIACWKLAQALAAGNTVLLKPSSLTPLTALALGDIIQKAGLPSGVVNIVNAVGYELGKVLCADKRIDLISFTGSNASGKAIIEYASKNVKKLIMELGGKSASLVLDDADLELAVNGSLCSIFLNQGQMCTAMSRIFVQEGIYERFLADFVDKVKRIKLGDGLDYQTQMGPLISNNQRKRVLEFVDKARKEGAKIIYGGQIPTGLKLKNGYFITPAVLTEVSPQMQVFQEEVFGPVAIVEKFSNISQGIELANSSDFALAGCIWSQDQAKAEQIASQINAGTVWVNTYGMFFNELPYGGFKQSGFGKELGKAGFLEYTRLKNVVFDKTRESKPLVNFWYGF
jgi:acyl-CoA reductase-like NAD-dependent aldehyde dehydrogenase